MVLFHEPIVFFTSVTGIGYVIDWIFPVAMLEPLHERFQGEGITRVREKIIMGEKLVFSSNLHIVRRF